MRKYTIVQASDRYQLLAVSRRLLAISRQLSAGIVCNQDLRTYRVSNAS